jgi:hypothetical protein
MLYYYISNNQNLILINQIMPITYYNWIATNKTLNEENLRFTPFVE